MNTAVEIFSNTLFSAHFVWIEDQLARIDLSATPQQPSAPISKFGKELNWIIQNYAWLTTDAWPDMPLDKGRLTTFSQRVLDHLRQNTPRGCWTTYGQLAADCKSPGAARAVGGVMARNPWPLLYPCHRVLASDHGLGGFGPGLGLKKQLLILEKALPEQRRG